MRRFTLYSLTSVAMAVLLVTGCGPGTGVPTGRADTTTPSSHAVPKEDNHDHAHPSEGPHHGELIELGDDEYHAELLHPQQDGEGHEGESVTVYVLDGSAKNTVPIEATEVMINLSHDGKPEQFKLPAMPTETDPQGMSSRFASADKNLLEHFHEEEIEGTLVLTINGKSYRGKIAHTHDGHDHEHKHE